MSLLVQSRPDQSLAGMQARVAARIRMTSFSTFNQMQQSYQQLYNAVWANPMGLTPQQVVGAVGTDAAQLFTLLSILSTAINAATPGAITPGAPSGYTVTLKADGTVTITGGT